MAETVSFLLLSALREERETRLGVQRAFWEPVLSVSLTGDFKCTYLGEKKAMTKHKQDRKRRQKKRKEEKKAVCHLFYSSDYISGYFYF